MDPRPFFTVQQESAAIIQRLGKFSGIAQAGFHLKAPFLDRIAGRVNLRVRQLDTQVETKTRDNVFVHVIVSVQFFVIRDKIFEAFYRLNNPEAQIQSYVFDVVRAQVPKIKLDDVFEKKDEIAQVVKSELTDVMDDFGYGIQNVLVTDIDPDAKVKDAMNDINAAERLRVAAEEKGEAEKILKVKAAEAEAESMALAGKGIADQRLAIVEGLRESVDRVPENGPRHLGPRRDEPDPDDPVLRHAQGGRPRQQDQHHPDPAFAGTPVRPQRADPGRDDHRLGGQRVREGGLNGGRRAEAPASWNCDVEPNCPGARSTRRGSFYVVAASFAIAVRMWAAFASLPGTTALTG